MRCRRGFTLVELVVVVLIVGIIAAVAAPRMFDVAGAARDSGTRQSLTVLRDAIELYRAANGSLPGQSNNLPSDLGPYLKGPFPTSQVGTQDANITYVTGTGIAGDGIPITSWKYSTDAGELIVNSTSATVSDPTVTYDQW